MHGALLAAAAAVTTTAQPSAAGDLEALWRRLWEGLQRSGHLYVLAFGIIFVAFVTRRLIAGLLLQWLARWSRSTRTELDDRIVEAIRRPLSFAIVVLGLALAGAVLPLSAEVEAVFDRLITVLAIGLVGWVAINLCDVVAYLVEQLTDRTASSLDDQLVPIVRRSLKLFVGLMAFILIVQNLGYPIGALLAGFSIGGAAIALASQDTLANVFGSVVIFVDRPFQIGDWIEVEGLEGVVEEVGLRSTRIRTFAKTLITVPNSKIAHKAINNYSRMPKRRVKQVIGIGYDTEPARVRAVVHAFRTILREDERVDQQFWMVHFSDFGASSLDIFVYYFTKTTAWAEYMQVKEEISLRFMETLERMGVEIAFPTRTVYLRQDAPLEKPPLEAWEAVEGPAGSSPPAPADADAADDG
ncbi:MAG: mechanosensitive ion channel family protein [Planctomycetota bacterium]|nr:MAG: mechanosensitive ion channel family protein [Planctomycetota bacterium]